MKTLQETIETAKHYCELNLVIATTQDDAREVSTKAIQYYTIFIDILSSAENEESKINLLNQLIADLMPPIHALPDYEMEYQKLIAV